MKYENMGHICFHHIKGDCPRCVTDGYNEYCPAYKPVRIRIIRVFPREDILERPSQVEHMTEEEFALVRGGL